MGITKIPAGFGKVQGPRDMEVWDVLHVVWEVMIGDVAEWGDLPFGFGCTLVTNDLERRRLDRGGVGPGGESI